MPAVDLFWYDGGMKPRLPEEVEALDFEISKEGIMFIGDEGTIMAGFHGQDPQLFAKGKKEPFKTTEPSTPDAGRQGGKYVSRQSPWLQAVLEGGQSPGSFLKAGPISDAVNLGAVALRAGKKVLFDSDKMKISNAADANKFLYREYREGWEL